MLVSSRETVFFAAGTIFVLFLISFQLHSSASTQAQGMLGSQVARCTKSSMRAFQANAASWASPSRTTGRKWFATRRQSVVRAKKEDEPQGHQDGRPRREPTEKEKRIMEYQQNAPKLSFAEEAKSLVTFGNGYGVISTITKDEYPGGAVVMYAPDDDGLPAFSFSTMSGHTQDLMKNPKASLTVTTNDFKGAADARVNLVGDIEKITDEEELKKYREIFIKKHPNAFWVNFGDFLVYRMTSLKHIRFVGGFARAANIQPGEYLEASADPVMEFAEKIAGHMNDDHQDATKLIMQHQMGLECETAEIKNVDRLGMTVFVTVKQPDETVSSPFKLRVGFPEEAPDRVGVRNMLKRMTMEAASALKAEAEEGEEEEAAAAPSSSSSTSS